MIDNQVSITCMLFWVVYQSLRYNLTLTAIVGDITPSDGIPKVEKSRLEQAALNEMCNVLGGGMRGTSNCPLSHLHIRFVSSNSCDSFMTFISYS